MACCLLNCLTSAQVTGQPPVTFNYKTNDNIHYKEDLGSYVYSTTQPNAVEKIWCGSVPYAPQQDITYTPFNKTATITEGNYELTYTYGPDQQRRKSVLTNTSTVAPRPPNGGEPALKSPVSFLNTFETNKSPFGGFRGQWKTIKRHSFTMLLLKYSGGLMN